MVHETTTNASSHVEPESERVELVGWTDATPQQDSRAAVRARSE
jgi:hypothetical protein